MIFEPIKASKEQQFRDAWTEITQSLLARGSQGSRLHEADDGLWYSYAQWPSASARSDTFALPLGQVEASAAMEDAIEERFPEVVLKVVADFLVD